MATRKWSPRIILAIVLLGLLAACGGAPAASEPTAAPAQPTAVPGLSMGEGILETRPGGYQPIGENPPRRERSGPSPLDRDAWLAWLARRG